MVHRYGEKRKGSESAKELSGVALLSATMNQCKKGNQQLLVPITVWIGMEQAFIGADFTQVMNAVLVHKTMYSIQSQLGHFNEFLLFFLFAYVGLCIMCNGHSQHWLCDDLFRCC